MNLSQACRAAAFVASNLVLAASALAQVNADLSTTISANVTTVAANGNLTVTVTVANLPQYKQVCTFDPDTHRKVCEPVLNSANASGVVVDISWTGGATLSMPAVGDSGLNCQPISDAVVRCTGGFIAAGDAARITIPLRAPNAGGALSVTAVADPANAIAERSETNNGAGVAVTVRPPPNPNLADLTAYAYPLQSTTDGKQPVEFNVVINNAGPVDAYNVSVDYFVRVKSELATPIFSGDTAFDWEPIWDPLHTYWVGIRVTKVFIRAWGSVTMKVRAIPFWPPLQPNGATYPLTGQLDPLGLVQELNEDNNGFGTGVLVVHP